MRFGAVAEALSDVGGHQSRLLGHRPGLRVVGKAEPLFELCQGSLFVFGRPLVCTMGSIRRVCQPKRRNKKMEIAASMEECPLDVNEWPHAWRPGEREPQAGVHIDAI